MKKKKQKNNREMKISVSDYLKAVKKADREIQLEKSSGWVAIHKIHTNKKLYNRKNNKDFLSEEE